MPKLFGPEGEGESKRRLALTKTQYSLFERWSRGMFKGPRDSSHEDSGWSEAITPEGLDRAALGNSGRRLLLLRGRLPIATGQTRAEGEARHSERQGRAEADRSGHSSLLNGPGASAGPSFDTLQVARVPVSLTDLLEKWREVSFFQRPGNGLAAFP